MKIDVSRIDEEPISFDEELTLDQQRLDEDVVAGEVRAKLRGTVRPVDGRLFVDGTVAASGTLACSRCLAPVRWQMDESFSLEYRSRSFEPGEGDFAIEDDDLDVAFFDGDELDLRDVAAEQVMLALPMRIVCDESCAGLCPRCGANRNVEGACRCEPEVDPRWQALQGITGRGSPN